MKFITTVTISSRVSTQKLLIYCGYVWYMLRTIITTVILPNINYSVEPLQRDLFAFRASLFGLGFSFFVRITLTRYTLGLERASPKFVYSCI